MGKLKRDGLLGSLKLPISEAIQNADKAAEWHNLDEGKGGKILFSIIYIPNEVIEDKSDTISDNNDVKLGEKNSSEEKDEGSKVGTAMSKISSDSSNIENEEKEVSNIEKAEIDTEVCATNES